MRTTKYLISVVPGIDPTIYQKTSKGFVEASNKRDAVFQAAKILKLPTHRLVAQTKYDLGKSVWEAESQLYET